MLKFKEFLSEAKSDKNLHLAHLDEIHYLTGKSGALKALKYLDDFVDTLGSGDVAATVKWDGAPALFAGYDPADGKFFIGTKSVFNKNPIIYKSVEEIKKSDEPGGKKDKLVDSFEPLQKVVPKNFKVYQGDLLWVKSSLYNARIDGEDYVCAHPNTLVYAWPYRSDIAKQIIKSKIGIVWHTVYSGTGELANYSSSFGVKASEFNRHPDCWLDDAYFKGADVGLSQRSFDKIKKDIDKAKSLAGSADKVLKIMQTIPSSAMGAEVKSFVNAKIRNKSYPKHKAFSEYVEHVKNYYQSKVIDKMKSEKGKETKTVALRELLKTIMSNKSDFEACFEFGNIINDAKVVLINKLNKMNKQKMFLQKATGEYIPTTPEGFVAVAKDKSAVKFVDRLEFSTANFSDEYRKGWQK